MDLLISRATIAFTPLLVELVLLGYYRTILVKVKIVVILLAKAKLIILVTPS